MQTRRRIQLITISFPILLASAIALAFPLLYAVPGYQHLLGSLEAQADINAQAVTRLINANPELWRYETLRIQEVLAHQPSPAPGQSWQIRDSAGLLVVENGAGVAWPSLTVARDLHDAGEGTGRILIRESLRPLLQGTALATLVGAAAGLGLFLLLLLPHRAVRRAWDKLEEAHGFLLDVMDGSSSTIIVLDPAGTIRMASASCRELLGSEPADLAGRPGALLFPGEALAGVRGRIAGSLGPAPEPVTFEADLPHPDGRLVTVAGAARPMLHKGRHAGVVLVLDDMTERRRIEEDRHRMDKLESIGQLAGGIAHDFNNLLTGIMANLSMVEATLPPGDPNLARLAAAEKASVRAAGLTRQLLTFAKGGLPVKKRTAMAPLLREAATFATLGGTARCEFALPDGLWPCDVDPGQIAQVIHNLVLNAVQAMPGGGTITLTAANSRIVPGAPGPLPAGDYLRITIQDQGAGIPEDLLDKIFTPYFTTKPGGSGLGLATCFSILRKHAGLIEASSTPGAGSTFTLHLPAVAGASLAEAGTGAGLVRGKGRILVMDDEELLRDTAVAMLRTLGYQAVPARDGAEAVVLYRDAAGGPVPFTGVILDLTVPGGMGGQEAMARLRDFDPRVRALVSSGYSDSAVMSDHARAGFRGVLRKPYNLEQMGQALGDLAGRSTEAGEGRS